MIVNGYEKLEIERIVGAELGAHFTVSPVVPYVNLNISNPDVLASHLTYNMRRRYRDRP
jgi:hypothetical protein